MNRKNTSSPRLARFLESTRTTPAPTSAKQWVDELRRRSLARAGLSFREAAEMSKVDEADGPDGTDATIKEDDSCLASLQAAYSQAVQSGDKDLAQKIHDLLMDLGGDDTTTEADDDNATEGRRSNRRSFQAHG